jgi:hypothetical protein
MVLLIITSPRNVSDSPMRGSLVSAQMPTSIARLRLV